MDKKIRAYQNELNIITEMFKQQNKIILDNFTTHKQVDKTEKKYIMENYPKSQDYLASVCRSYASEEFQRTMCD